MKEPRVLLVRGDRRRTRVLGLKLAAAGVAMRVVIGGTTVRSRNLPGDRVRPLNHDVRIPVMAHTLVAIDCRRIEDWPSFHAVFAEALGFPASYGSNMNAWIDCLTYIDEVDDNMHQIHAPEGGVLVIQLDHARDFMARCSELYEALVKSSAFVNWRRIEQGGSPVLALSFWE